MLIDIPFKDYGSFLFYGSRSASILYGVSIDGFCKFPTIGHNVIVYSLLHDKPLNSIVEGATRVGLWEVDPNFSHKDEKHWSTIVCNFYVFFVAVFISVSF